ncbi:MAG: polysaccharide export protein, partial [Duncaniella sp.]|nr:polysaccharide export protein [Duncaniella sp.]
MQIKTIIGGILGATLLLSSCSTPKNITYFPELHNGSIVQAEKMIDIRVKPEDKLSIVVSTQDPNLNNLFNLVTTTNRLTQTTSSIKS